MARSDYVEPISLKPLGVFQVHYKGGLAEKGIVEAESFAKSLAGVSRLYSALAHYVDTGTVLRGNARRKLRIYTGVTRLGQSIDTEFWLLPVQYAASVYAADPRAAQLVFGGIKILSGFVAAWYSRPGSRERQLKIATDAMVEISRQREETNREREITARENLVETRRMIEALTVGNRNSPDRLAESLGSHVEDFVEPVGRSCDSIVQFPAQDGEIALGVKEAESIRGVAADLAPLRWMRVLNIDGVRKRTGYCTVLVEEFGERIRAKITDETLRLPNNPYTRAQNLDLELDVLAQAAMRDGRPSKLYIREAKERA